MTEPHDADTGATNVIKALEKEGGRADEEEDDDSLLRASDYSNAPSKETIHRKRFAAKKKVSYYAVRPGPGLYFQEPVIFLSLEDLEFALSAISIHRHLATKENSFQTIREGRQYLQFDNLANALANVNIKDDDNENSNRKADNVAENAQRLNTTTISRAQSDVGETTSPRKRKRAGDDGDVAAALNKHKTNKDAPFETAMEKRFDETFEHMVEEIKAYKAEHGNLSKRTNEWVWRQRRHYSNLMAGKPSPLRLKHIVAFNSIDLPYPGRTSNPMPNQRKRWTGTSPLSRNMAATRKSKEPKMRKKPIWDVVRQD